MSGWELPAGSRIEFMRTGPVPVQVPLERYGQYDPGPAPHPVMHRMAELGMDRRERGDLERAWADGEIAGERCDRQHGPAGPRCLHIAAYRVRNGCLGEHVSDEVFCWCCGEAVLRLLAAGGRLCCTRCGNDAAVVVEPLRPAPPDREELTG